MSDTIFSSTASTLMEAMSGEHSSSLVPVRGLAEACCCRPGHIVMKRHKRWFWQREQTFPTDFKLSDILSDEDAAINLESFRLAPKDSATINRTLKLKSKVDGNVVKKSKDSLKIPADTAIAFCMLNLRIKPDRAIQLVLFPDSEDNSEESNLTSAGNWALSEDQCHKLLQCSETERTALMKMLADSLSVDSLPLDQARVNSLIEEFPHVETLLVSVGFQREKESGDWSLCNDNQERGEFVSVGEMLAVIFALWGK
ncbi:uncharacterized protein [Diadema setosum]|uniref:uncharacterized protein n=1 Tax=Diadema setosum TaxID=31175 RepID=UPI003B3ADBF6